MNYKNTLIANEKYSVFYYINFDLRVYYISSHCVFLSAVELKAIQQNVIDKHHFIIKENITQKGAEDIVRNIIETEKVFQ